MGTRLANGVINRWIHLLTPCQGQSDSPSVSLQEQQVTSSDSLRGQTATPRVSAQQIDSDDEEMAYFAAESFVIDQEHDVRIWATLDEGCNAACHSASWAARAERHFDMFGFQSEYREGTQKQGFHWTWWQYGCRSWTSQVSVCTCFHS